MKNKIFVDHGTEIIDFIVVDNDMIIVDHEYLIIDFLWTATLIDNDRIIVDLEYIILDFFVDHNTNSAP